MELLPKWTPQNQRMRMHLQILSQQAEQYEFGKEDGKDINIAALCEALGWPTKRNISYKMRRKEELNKL